MLKQRSEENKQYPNFQEIKKRTNNIHGDVFRRSYENTSERLNEKQSPGIQNMLGRTKENDVGTSNDNTLIKSRKQLKGTDTASAFNTKKPFRSRYIDDNGAWTYASVDEGYTEFDDYIKDKRYGVDNGISFNGKQFTPSNSYNQRDLYDYTLNSEYDEDKDAITYNYNETGQDLEQYEIEKGSDELAGIGEFADTISDYIEKGKEFVEDIPENLLKGGEKLTRTMVQGVISLGKKSKHYGKVVSAAKRFWSLGADIILENMQCHSSAWLLKHALEDNPSKVYRDNNSRIAWLVNHDNKYLSELDKEIRASKDGTIDADLKNIKFEKHDLYFSIHNATIHVNGYKQENGKWIIHSVLKDTYDFTKLMWFDPKEWENMSATKLLGITANDVATISSWGDVIKPYKIEIEFYTTR